MVSPGANVAEALGALVGEAEQELALIPAVDERCLAYRDRRAAAVRVLHRAIAPHVIGMAMGVQEPREPLAAERVRDQRERLRGVREVAGVDQRRAVRAP